MKFLIFGLGNMEPQYIGTRHNIGFDTLSYWAEKEGLSFEPTRYADRAEARFKGKKFILLKPSTYMNLSGKAVNYWLQKEKTTPERMFVIVDEIALPFGTIRIRAKGSDGGHNGLAHINQVLGGSNYPRLRFGIGDEYAQGRQIDYVLGKWAPHEMEKLPQRMDRIIEAVKGFGTIGLTRAMNFYNGT